ncbi:hypothetical protein [Siccirubricoccus phaeus]|uniref:hypothetical protein n=1 Tax=Siccirubricoccus phaeus TaxID=2595053 RepID=UPI0011F0E6B9|nr:hypothetical protein [Siccirubricoccus phaeus]
MTLYRVELPEDVAAALERVALSRGSTPEALLRAAASALVQADPAAERAALETMLAEAEAEIDAGRAVPHAEVMEELRGWAAGLRQR